MIYKLALSPLVKVLVLARNFSNNIALVQLNSMIFCMSLLSGDTFICYSVLIRLILYYGQRIDLVVLRLCGYFDMQAGIISLG